MNVLCQLNWIIINLNVLIYFIIFVYAMISCVKYHEISLFYVDLLLATLQFYTTPNSFVVLNRQCRNILVSSAKIIVNSNVDMLDKSFM